MNKLLLFFRKPIHLLGLILAIAILGFFITKWADSSQPSLTYTGLKPIRLPKEIRTIPSLSLHPTGKKAAFTGVLGEHNMRLYIVDLESGKVENTFSSEGFSLIDRVEWLPDGQNISFFARPEQNPPGGIFLWEYGSNSDPQYLGTGWPLRWSPDGSKLAFLEKGISIWDKTTETSHDVFSFDPQNKQTIGSLDWSPDGNWLVFSTLGEKNGYSSFYLYRVQSDGKNFQQLLNDPYEGPVISTVRWIDDRKWIVVRMGSGGNLRIKFVSADGRCRVDPLKELKDIMELDISDDGTKAVLVSGGELYSLDVTAALAPLSLEEILVCE